MRSRGLYSLPTFEVTREAVNRDDLDVPLRQECRGAIAMWVHGIGTTPLAVGLKIPLMQVR